MTQLFSGGAGTQITRLREETSTNEGVDLHKLIDAYPELIPGEEIAPENPAQWLVIKSEVPIADPENGQDRWWLDLLLGDQQAWPAMVECKLMKNAEIRREIIGQAIEYAANAQYYWDAQELRKFALDRYQGQLPRLDEQLQAIGWSGSSDEYFEAFMRNLRDGQFRLIFAVDDAPHRLRSTVEFLNRELESVEAVVVEIRQYRVGVEQMISSRVLGYTEEIRHAKRDAAVRRGGESHDTEGFIAGIRSLQIAGLEEATKRLLDGVRKRDWGVRFSDRGNLLVAAPFSDKKTMFGVDRQSSGYMEWHVGAHEKSRGELASTLRLLAEETGTTAIGPYPKSPAAGWVPKIDSIFERLDRFGGDT